MKQEKIKRGSCQLMLGQDGTELLKFQWSKRIMIKQQICGALAAFSMNF